MPRRRQTGSPHLHLPPRRLGTFRPGPTSSSSAAGFTGLWTAHYLLRRGPVPRRRGARGGARRLRRERAQRRLVLGPVAGRAADAGPPAAAPRPRERCVAELQHTVDEVGRATESAAIDCGFRKGGTIALARTPAQAARARAEVDDAAEWGVGTRWLDAAEASERLAASRVEGATFSPHCARVHPRRLVRGLAVTVRAPGRTGPRGRARCRRSSPAGSCSTAAVRSPRRTSSAPPRRGRARLPGQRRTVAPVYSLMVATEPLTDEQSGRGSGSPSARSSPTTGTSSSTASARSTTGSPSVVAARPTTSDPASRPSSTTRQRFSPTSARPSPTCFPAGRRASSPTPGAVRSASPRDWHPSVGLRPRDRARVGRRLRRRRRRGHQPRRPHAGRPRHRPGHPDHPAALGGPPQPPAGSPNRSAGPGSTRACGSRDAADREEARTGRPARIARLLAALTGH